MTSSTLALLITLLVPAIAGGQRSGSTISTGEIFQAIGVREGITVCEMGAGDGELTIAAAELVGPNGRVFTSELGDDRVKALQKNVSGRTRAQVRVVAGDPDRTNFPEQACDALFMRNVYHHFADPARINQSILAALKPGGRVAVVDFTPPGPEAGQAADRARDGTHGVSAESVSRELLAAGFEPVSSEAGAEHWFMVVVAKPGR
jgi:tRNA A58 N-methylase Trm61